MTGGRYGWCVLGLALGAASCVQVLDVDGFDYGAASASTVASGGAGGSGGLPMGGAGPGGAGGNGGAGGGDPCGNGVLEAGEECDDNGNDSGDGCSDVCVVECAGVGYTKEPTSHHCYFLEGKTANWSTARAACVAHGAGWDLAAINSITERDFVDDADIPTSNLTWVGGSDMVTEGVYTWSNGEAWSADATALLGVIDGDTQDCLYLNRVFGDLNDDLRDAECTLLYPSLCELTPAGS